MCDSGTMDVLQSLGIDLHFLQDLQVMTYSQPGSSFPIELLIDQMLTCRAGLNAQVKHVVIQTKLIQWFLGNDIKSLEKRIDALQKDIQRDMQRNSAKLLKDLAMSQSKPPHQSKTAAHHSKPVLSYVATGNSRPSSPDQFSPHSWKTAAYRRKPTRARSPTTTRARVIRQLTAEELVGDEEVV